MKRFTVLLLCFVLLFVGCGEKNNNAQSDPNTEIGNNETEAKGEVEKTFMESIFSVPEGKAIEYAKTAIDGGNEREWIYNYRYKTFSTEKGYGVVLIDGSMNRSAMVQSIAIAGVVLLVCAVLVLALILLLSKRAVKPIAESYELTKISGKDKKK